MANYVEIPGTRMEMGFDTGDRPTPIWWGYLKMAEEQKASPNEDYGRFKVEKTEADPESERVGEAVNLQQRYLLIAGAEESKTVVRVVKVEAD